MKLQILRFLVLSTIFLSTSAWALSEEQLRLIQGLVKQDEAPFTGAAPNNRPQVIQVQPAQQYNPYNVSPSNPYGY